MRILPVLDIMGGVVVRGVAGRRHEYRPIVSRLTDSSQPVAVARMFRDRFEFTELYIADLDAIAGAPPALGVYDQLHELGCRLWVDAGVRQLTDAKALSTIHKIVLGLETLAGPAMLTTMVTTFGAEKLVFSLDLKAGQPMGDRSAWGHGDAWAIARLVIDAGIRSLIILDLSQVGVNSGPGTEELCRRINQAYPDIELIAGGGVRDIHDLQRLSDCGVHAALVASALHDERITAPEIRALGTRQSPLPKS